VLAARANGRLTPTVRPRSAFLVAKRRGLDEDRSLH